MTNEAEAAVDRATEVVNARQVEIADLDGEIADVKATIAGIAAKEEVTQKELLLDANERRRLQRLERRREDATSALQSALDELASAKLALAESEKADRQALIDAEVEEIRAFVASVRAQLAERIAAHRARIREANRLDPTDQTWRARRGSPYADVLGTDVLAEVAAIDAEREKAERRSLKNLPDAPPAVAPAESASLPAEGVPGAPYVAAGVGAPPGDWNTAMVRHVERQASLDGAGPGRCASDVNVSE